MKEAFMNIDEEKRKRVINSALEEFSQNDFKKASTNNIVKKAGISKGLLYHYFTNKEALYCYIKTFALETVVNEISENIDWHQTDLLERTRQIVKIKLDLTYQYPYIYDFILKLYQGKTFEEMKELSNEVSAGLYEKVYSHNIDYSKFKEDIDLKRALTIINWSLEKYSESIFQKYNQTGNINDEDWQEINLYIKVLKKAFYKEEYI